MIVLSAQGIMECVMSSARLLPGKSWAARCAVVTVCVATPRGLQLSQRWTGKWDASALKEACTPPNITPAY